MARTVLHQVEAVKGVQQFPPGPKGHFLVGSLLELSRDWMGFLTQCARDYGDVVFFRFLNVPICLVSHPDYIEYVLVTNQRNFVKSKDYRAVRRVLGHGLLTSEGEFWRRQRRLAQPAFHRERIAAYSALMVVYAEQMLDAWRDGATCDIHQEMMKLTLRVVAKALFDADASEDAVNVGAALHVVMDQFTTRANIAFLLPEGFPIPSGLRFERAARQLDGIIYGIIRERRAGGRDSGDLLSMLLQAQDEDGNRMTDEQLRDEVMTLFLAGHETTANALSWTWYLLGLHSEVEQKLWAELDQVLGGRAPALDDLPRLPYTEMVVKESMRLYPPAWGIGREALEDFEVGGYHLPAGTNLFLSQWIMHRDSRYYEKPEEFNPERWRLDPIRQGTLPRFAYFPFGGGPRVCIGAGFAMMEATLLLATIARRFKLKLAPGHPVKIFPSVTLRPKHGIKVVLNQR